jgi:hypothetical protein
VATHIAGVIRFAWFFRSIDIVRGYDPRYVAEDLRELKLSFGGGVAGATFEVVSSTVCAATV